MMLIFMIQGTMIATLFDYFANYPKIQAYNPFLLLCMFAVSFIIHTCFQPGIGDILNKLKYLHTHADKFEQTFIPMMTCLCQASTIICYQILDCYCYWQFFDSELWLVMCYSTIQVIADLDNLYFMIMNRKCQLRRKFEKMEKQLPIVRPIDLNFKLLFAGKDETDDEEPVQLGFVN